MRITRPPSWPKKYMGARRIPETAVSRWSGVANARENAIGRQ